MASPRSSLVVALPNSDVVSESLLLLKDEVPQNEVDSVVSALIRSGDWLCKRSEVRVMNQQTGPQ